MVQSSREQRKKKVIEALNKARSMEFAGHPSIYESAL